MAENHPAEYGVHGVIKPPILGLQQSDSNPQDSNRRLDKYLIRQGIMSYSISASGMTAQRVRMDVISNNIANANTMVTAEGSPFRRREVLFEAPGTYVC